MTSDLKNIYYNRYKESDFSSTDTNQSGENENIYMPVGWSFICLDETINYCTEHTNKNLNEGND
uniref:Uncharacterized protein n=1 Tax=Alsidium seaforthii TaxID=2007182 RepID=A0A1Z1MCU4_9FLOR|nr:hypothetical protein [Bryothamnion seaforthii]ARW63917.1 hypothetical protein [Bryothamnion seaforthii]